MDWIRRLFASQPRVPALAFARLRSLSDWQAHADPVRCRTRLEAERRLVPAAGSDFSVPGFCWIDRAPQDFAADFLYGGVEEGARLPNWRERLTCPACGFNNRQRAAVHAFETELSPGPKAAIYLTEQVSPVYQWLKSRYPASVGSEYLGETLAPGSFDARGLRHEDVTQLSFAAGSFDFILSFDVFEHVPDYPAAFRECARVLRPEGRMLFTVPFLANSDSTLVRASVAEDGTITHTLPAEYHGDPVQPTQGVLCYQHFGWQMLDELRQAGFRDAWALAFHSFEYGYLGGEHLQFVAAR